MTVHNSYIELDSDAKVWTMGYHVIRLVVVSEQKLRHRYPNSIHPNTPCRQWQRRTADCLIWSRYLTERSLAGIIPCLAFFFPFQANPYHPGQVQCRIFSLNFNPERARLGNKILRQRLRGPALAAWYPRKTVSFRDLQDTYSRSGLTMFDEAEDDREEAIQMYVA